jgi:hypothetical protein
VAELECTSTIQYFRRGGLAWVDTPGLGSLTTANAELARRYAQSAELVVAVTDSGQPMRMSEAKELAELAGAGKRIVVVVSKFDRGRPVYDEDDNVVGVQFEPKDDNARREQYEWVEKQISGAGVSDALAHRDYQFVSVRVAEHALATDDGALLERSGIPRFLNTLASVLRAGPAELKLRAPRIRLNTLVDNLNREAEELSEELGKRKDQLETRRKAFLAEAGPLRTRIQGHVLPVMRERIDAAVRKASAGGTDIEIDPDTPVTDALRSELEAASSQHLGGAERELLSGLELMARKGRWKASTVFEEREVPNEEAKGKGGAVGGVVGALGVMGLVAAGVLTGGAAVAVLPIVASMGKYLGERVGESVGGRTKRVRVQVGTNADELYEKLSNEMGEHLRKRVENGLQAIARDYFDRRIRQLLEAQEALLDMKSQINKEKFADA